jgi:hypothetical protein
MMQMQSSDWRDDRVCVVNGFAISATPDDRKPQEPGQLVVRVWVRMVRPAAAWHGKIPEQR